jgi:electron transport complex protein RnfB
MIPSALPGAAPAPAGNPGALAASVQAARLPAEGDGPLVRAIDALLPQTQCGQCGFGGCLPYARALADGTAPINRCPPGGPAGVADLASLLGRDVIALDPQCGTPRPLHVALIDESRCIGCTLCIQACPVDAIVGAAKAMHTVVAAECTGCDLCLPPCPMDCIRMVPVQPLRAWTRADADLARQRLRERERRLAQAQAAQEARLAAKARHKLEELRLEESRLAGRPGRGDLAQAELARRRTIVEQALERVRQRRARDGA